MFGRYEYLLTKAALRWLLSINYILLKYKGMDANRLKDVAHFKILWFFITKNYNLSNRKGI
jgi:uncharacterized phage-associated protein